VANVPYQIDPFHDLHKFLAVMSGGVSNYFDWNDAIRDTKSPTHL
jgi:hypothetical protein